MDIEKTLEAVCSPECKQDFFQENLPDELQELPAKPRIAKPAPQTASLGHSPGNAAGKTIETKKPVEKAEVAAGDVNNQPQATQKAVAPDDNGEMTQFSLGDSNEALAGEGPIQNAEANTLNRFTVQADRKVWIQIKIDGQKTRSEMLYPGDRREWVAAKSLEVVIGDAGGVQMKWNGQPLEAPHVAGRVLRFRLPDYVKPAQG